MLMTTAFTMSDTNGVPYDRLVQGPGAFNAAGALTSPRPSTPGRLSATALRRQARNET